jgi:hypothetical protein
MAATPDIGWDLSVTDRHGKLALVVEVKGKTNASPTWAAALRRNILAHGTLPTAPYFLMAFPDIFYLWINTEAKPEQIEPTYIIDAHPILKPYFEKAGITADHISGQSLELILASWLGEILHTEQSPEDFDDSLQWLVASGLYEALAGGKFEHEAAA